MFVRCNTRIGIQVCLDVQMKFRPILCDGLVLHPLSTLQLEQWKYRYSILHAFYEGQWSEKEWNERGFYLYRRRLPYKPGVKRALRLRPRRFVLVPMPKKVLWYNATTNTL